MKKFLAQTYLYILKAKIDERKNQMNKKKSRQMAKKKIAAQVKFSFSPLIFLIWRWCT